MIADATKEAIHRLYVARKMGLSDDTCKRAYKGLPLVQELQDCPAHFRKFTPAQTPPQE